MVADLFILDFIDKILYKNLSPHDLRDLLPGNFDGLVKSPAAALRGNPALLDKRLRIWE
jgi:hypothetical protein